MFLRGAMVQCFEIKCSVCSLSCHRLGDWSLAALPPRIFTESSAVRVGKQSVIQLILSRTFCEVECVRLISQLENLLATPSVFFEKSTPFYFPLPFVQSFTSFQKQATVGCTEKQNLRHTHTHTHIHMQTHTQIISSRRGQTTNNQCCMGNSLLQAYLKYRLQML